MELNLYSFEKQELDIWNVFYIFPNGLKDQ